MTLAIVGAGTIGLALLVVLQDLGFDINLHHRQNRRKT